MRGLQGKIALVTGATGVIGRAITARLATEGATVIATSRERSRVERMLHEMKLDGACVPTELDLMDPASIMSLVETCRKSSRWPTILIASATWREGLQVPFDQIRHESFADLTRNDIGGHCLLFRDIVAGLAGKPASIIFLSSVYSMVGVDHRIYPSGFSSTPLQYAATKGAAVSTTRWLAAYWGAKGVRVNAVIAGGVLSDRNRSQEFLDNYSAKTMLGRMASADEIASATAFLASDDASYITGESLVVDGGLSAW